MLSRNFCFLALGLVLLFQAACGGPSAGMNWVPPDDPQLQWLNVADWEAVDGALRPVRVPQQWREQFPEQTANTALAPAGVALRVETNSPTVALRVSVPPPPQREGGQQQAQQGGQQQQAQQGGPPRPSIPRATAFDVYRNGQFVQSVEPSTEPGVQELIVYEDPAGNNVELSVLFPYGASFLVHGVGFYSGAQYGPPSASARSRVLFHGDSITQGVGTSQARNSYVWVVCEQLGCETINLGFAGSAWGDKPVADYIASRNDWNMAVIAYGTNTYRRADENPEQFGITYDTFLSTIRATHPETPILCVTPLWRAADTTGEKNNTGFTHQQYRDMITRVVKRRQASDPNLYLLEGKNLVPEELFTADQVHPNDEGAAKMASAIVEVLKPLLNP